MSGRRWPPGLSTRLTNGWTRSKPSAPGRLRHLVTPGHIRSGDTAEFPKPGDGGARIGGKSPKEGDGHLTER